jgi:tRNA pseudouridine55 synthase
VGQATRGVSFAESGDKEYLAVLRLGLVTDTQDTSGQVLHRTEALPDRAALEAALPRFTGEISQLPPMYSAIKIGGKKLYELARQGKEVERRPRPVTIHALELVEQTASGDYVLRVRCSKGTYVRTLCHDIGQALGCGGCMSALRRTMAAGFTLAESRSIEDVQAQGEALLSPTDSLFRQYPAYHIAGERDHRRCLCGNPLAAEGLQPGLYRVYGPDGAFLCLSRWEAGVLTSEKNFFGA